MSERNWEKTNGIEHGVSVRAKRVVIAKTEDGEEVLLEAVPIDGTDPIQYALSVTFI